MSTSLKASCVDVSVLRLQEKCFPTPLTQRVRSVTLSATHRRLSSVPFDQHSPRPQHWSDWTGSKGSLFLSVSFLHIDLNDFFFFLHADQRGSSSGEAVDLSAFTSTQTVSSHTKQLCRTSTPVKPALDSQKRTLSV